MRAVILAGGAGQRLRPFSQERPAALAPVANRPIVEYLLEHLVRHRVDAATVTLHHAPYPLEAHLGDGSRWGLRLAFALERRPLGTAGAARAVAGRWDDTVLLAFANSLVTADLAKALAYHQLHGGPATLVLAPARAGAGDVALDDDGAVVPAGTPGLSGGDFTGLAFLDPRALHLARPGEALDLLDDLVPRLLAAGLPVQGYLTGEPALVVRTPANLVEATRRALTGELPGLVLPGFETEPGIRLSRGALVHRDARLIPPVMVGANAVIGRDTRVAATVIGEDVIVSARSSVRHAVLLPGTYVGRGLSLDGALVDRDQLWRAAAGSWTTVHDPRLLGATRMPIRTRRGGLGGRLLAAGLLAAAAPVWIPLGVALALETRGRPLRARRIVGAGGRDAAVWRVAVRGPIGRLLRRLGLTRGPHLWSVARGDLGWVGTSVHSPEAWAALAAHADLPAAPPGLVTLADLAPRALARGDRIALDRLYAATRSRRGDARLVWAALRQRLRTPDRAA